MDWHKITHETFELAKVMHFPLFAGLLIRHEKKEKDLGGLEVPGDNFPYVLFTDSSFQKQRPLKSF
jgi:hypothetical protein